MFPEGSHGLLRGFLNQGSQATADPKSFLQEQSPVPRRDQEQVRRAAVATHPLTQQEIGQPADQPADTMRLLQEFQGRKGPGYDVFGSTNPFTDQGLPQFLATSTGGPRSKENISEISEDKAQDAIKGQVKPEIHEEQRLFEDKRMKFKIDAFEVENRRLKGEIEIEEQEQQMTFIGDLDAVASWGSKSEIKA
ncbi:hypothetical protein SLEP1_g26532 [Rubroshorea leprosula]|uniref:Uncharacterized protein n=1 Tax=Rubroshorea leprosula TaxID=152421 RepID=A0AAV5JTN0_9ROSI|nr:hypothetical protein SLEP1_g26532 [Rubroshorea leprosula]